MSQRQTKYTSRAHRSWHPRFRKSRRAGLPDRRALPKRPRTARPSRRGGPRCGAPDMAPEDLGHGPDDTSSDRGDGPHESILSLRHVCVARRAGSMSCWTSSGPRPGLRRRRLVTDLLVAGIMLAALASATVGARTAPARPANAAALRSCPQIDMLAATHATRSSRAPPLATGVTTGDPGVSAHSDRCH
jgi:hypothetical protein